MIIALLIVLLSASINCRPQDHEPIPIARDNSARNMQVIEQPDYRPHRARHHKHRRHRHRHRDSIENDDEMSQYEKQRMEQERQRKAQEDAYYQQYFDRMKQYAVNVHMAQYRNIMRQQEAEKARFAKNMREYGLDSRDLAGVPDVPKEPEEKKPASPFGGINEGRQIEQRSIKDDAIRPVMQPPSGVDPSPENAEVHRKALHLEALCHRFLPTVKKHCYAGDKTEEKYASKCKGYFHDCQRFLPKNDPLYDIAYSFTSNVGLNLGTWDVKGIPYYPINEEGAIGAGRQMNIPFGSWGGGYSDHIGVRDYWSQYQEAGGNWYEGKFGYKSGWSVPLVQSLGVEGDTHAVVSVPTKPSDAGKPINVDVGGGVGPYYQQNQHVGVDPVHGQVNTNFGVGVPMAGVGVNTGVGVQFPGVNDILGR